MPGGMRTASRHGMPEISTLDNPTTPGTLNRLCTLGRRRSPSISRVFNCCAECASASCAAMVDFPSPGEALVMSNECTRRSKSAEHDRIAQGAHGFAIGRHRVVFRAYQRHAIPLGALSGWNRIETPPPLHVGQRADHLGVEQPRHQLGIAHRLVERVAHDGGAPRRPPRKAETPAADSIAGAEIPASGRAAPDRQCGWSCSESWR